MAKKVKKPISKPKKKGSSKKKSNSFITRLIIIIFVLIFAAFFVLKFTKNIGSKDKKQNPKTEVVKKEKKDKQEKREESKDKKDKKEEKEKTEKKKDKSTKENKEQEKKATETTAVEKSISGTWMSTTGGAVLTMKNKEYRLDFMGVDSDAPIIGTYSVDGDLITFTNKKDPCKDVKGLYEVRFNKQEIGFKCKSDDCTKRKATLPTEWEWLDTEE